MKKLLFVSIIMLCTVSATRAQDIVNLRMDRAEMGLRGYVATMDEDILLRKDYFREDWPQRKWFVNDLRSVLREDEGKVLKFNTAGRVTAITYTHQGKAGETTSCSYASNGLLSSYVGEGYKVVAKYHDNMADINVYAETKDYKTKNLAYANLNTTAYNNKYPFDLKCRQELTDDGHVLKSSYYYVDSIPAKVCEYSYNHLNQLVSERVKDYSSGEVQTSSVQYTYDNQGFLIRRVERGNALDETRTYENNELGDCVKMTVERPYGTVVYTYEYVYDTLQNWTVRLQFEDGIFDIATLRTLTYHKAPKQASDKKQNAQAQKDKDNAKAAKAVEKKAAKEAKASQKAEAKAERERIKEAEKNMTKEERKAAQEQRKAFEKAEKERIAAEKKAEKERIAAEKKAKKERVSASKDTEKDRAAAVKKAEKERAAAEKKAAKEREAAMSKAVKERIAAEKQAEKERKAAEKQAEKERKAAEKQAKKNK